MTPEEEEALEIVWDRHPPLETLPTVEAVCGCPGQIWPVPATRPFGRCGRCGEVTKLLDES